jgi:phosphate transport system protein
MPRPILEQKLKALTDDMLVLGSMVEKAICESVEVLRDQDLEAARRLVANDREINRQRFETEEKALVLVATQQPVAGDLRTIAAVLEITTELERMGDYAKGIAKICLMIGEEKLIKPLIDIPRMAEKVCDMIHRALDAFVRRDLELARALPAEDDMVDALYNQVYRELLTIMMGDPKTIDQASYLLWAAHNLERTADRVVNLCERTVFTITGEFDEFDSEDRLDAGPAGIR